MGEQPVGGSSREITVRYVTGDREAGQAAVSRLEQQAGSFSVSMETDARRALADAGTLDCLVVSSQLGEQDCIEYCTRVHRETTNVPCILHAHDGSVSLAERAQGAPVDAYVRGGDEAQYVVLTERIETHVQKQATKEEMNLLSSEYELVSDVASDIFWTYDVSNRELVADGGVEEFGYEPAAVESDVEWWLERVHPADRERVRSLYVSMLDGDRSVFDSRRENGGLVDLEFRLRCQDGSYAVCLVRTLCLCDDDGEPDTLVGSVTDVTEPREARQWFESLVESSSSVISVIDDDGFMLYNSPALERTLGYEPNELNGGFVYDFIHPADHERVEAAFVSIDETEKGVASAEFRVQHADGSWVWLEAIGTNQGDTELGGYVINCTDITERKQYERELEQFKRQYDAIFDDPDTFIGLLDTDGRLLDVNDAALEFIDAERETMLGERFPETRWWEGSNVERPQLEQYLERAADGENVRFDASQIGANGDKRYLDVIIRPVTDGDGVDSLTMIGRNITALKRREEALDALHEATRNLASAKSSQGVLERAVEAVEAIVANPLAGAWLYDEEQDALLPTANTSLAAETFKKQPVFEGGESLTWEAFEAGEPRYISATTEESNRYNEEPTMQSEIILPLDDAGVVTIGARERDAFDELDFALAQILAANTEAALQQAKRENTLRKQRSRLQRQNEQLEQVASIISHDLRNPLNVATLRTELAQRETDSEHLEDVETSLSRMEQLIDDVLKLARGGQLVTETEAIPIRDIVPECWTVVKTGEATLQLEESFSFQGSRSRLRHVFENLFHNAVEHGGSDVTIRVGTLEDGFYVEDDGPGIPAGKQDDVFGLGHTTSDDGSGFGLTIVETIAGAHEWDVRVAESADGGARFEFRNVELVS